MRLYVMQKINKQAKDLLVNVILNNGNLKFIFHLEKMFANYN